MVGEFLSDSFVESSTQRTSHIIIIGTDPESSSGGIGVVMRGYLAAIESAGISFESIPTYHPTMLRGKLFLWIKALPNLIEAIRTARSKKLQPIIYSHAGAGPSLFRESFLLLVSRILGAKTILQIHATQVDGYLNSTLKKFLFKMVLWPTTRACLLTPWWLARLQAAGIDSPLTVIPNPLPPDLQRVARDEKKTRTLDRNESEKALTVLTMARLVPGKGVDVVIRAMSYLPSWIKLIVAGDGKERLRLNELVQKLYLQDRVHFVGWVSGDKKTCLLESADIFCLPSTNDAFPLSFIEAMSHGVPVIGVKWGGIPDIVANGRVGLLVDVPEPDKIADAIKRLSDERLRQKMGAGAKRWVLEMSAAEVVGKKLKELFQLTLES